MFRYTHRDQLRIDIDNGDDPDLLVQITDSSQLKSRMEIAVMGVERLNPVERYIRAVGSLIRPDDTASLIGRVNAAKQAWDTDIVLSPRYEGEFQRLTTTGGGKNCADIALTHYADAMPPTDGLADGELPSVVGRVTLLSTSLLSIGLESYPPKQGLAGLLDRDVGRWLPIVTIALEGDETSK